MMLAANTWKNERERGKSWIIAINYRYKSTKEEEGEEEEEEEKILKSNRNSKIKRKKKKTKKKNMAYQADGASSSRHDSWLSAWEEMDHVAVHVDLV